jgi:hypothetical protein
VVDRLELSADLIRLLTEQADGAVGVSTVLFGAGGFGKTTLAQQVCWSAPVRRRFRDAVWVTLGEAPSQAELLAKIDSVAHALTGQHVDTGDVEQAGLRLGQVLDHQPEVLLVVDDLWRAADLRPFLQGGARACTRLITTRRPRLLPDSAARRSVKVDQLSDAQARAVLAAADAEFSQVDLSRLVELTGRWPLLVRLASGRRTAAVAGFAPASDDATVACMCHLAQVAFGPSSIKTSAPSCHSRFPAGVFMPRASDTEEESWPAAPGSRRLS